MLSPGIYPAAVTPFDASGRVDGVSVAKLLSWFEAGNCAGAVLAGTNGEGPSLSAVEKRDLLKLAMPLRGNLDLILGIATCSTDEAVWLCKQSHNEGAAAVLIMAPYYFREASDDGIVSWFEWVMSRSPIPVLVYNFPKRTGVTLTPEIIFRLSSHEMFAGAKDSSGEIENISGYKQAVGGKLLYIGDETLLWDALQGGWTGSISGAANILPMWLSQIVSEWNTGETESAETKFRLILPLIKGLRQPPQPSANKALLHRNGVINDPRVRPPLMEGDSEAVETIADSIAQITGLTFATV